MGTMLTTEDTEDAQQRFNRLILPNRRLLANQARRLTSGNYAEAEDLVQETLIRAFTHIDNVNCEATVRGWLCATLRNLYINRYNRALRTPNILSFTDSEEILQTVRTRRSAEPEIILMRRLECRAALTVLRNLPEKYREPVILADLEELSYQDISDRLGLPLGTVRSRIARGRRRIRRLLYAWDCLGR